MAEIVNVVYQLEEILASMKIPVHQRSNSLDGKEIDDYLCCIGRGLIQFVCVREGRGKNTSYRSLTADKIIIHPGSVMFRVDPDFIVAGEIVRTSRMYAMSVSPLSGRVLGELGLRDRQEFITQRHKDTKTRRKEDDREERFSQERKPRRKKERDFTHNIKIGDEVFEIETVKGKKVVMLPWERLAKIAEEVHETVFFKGLKGKIIVNNHFNLLEGEKLELILSLAPTLDVEGAFTRKWPRKGTFNVSEDFATLLEHMDSLARPVRWKKDAKDLGFLGLFTDGNGNYWLRASRGFHTSLNESLSSLETLIDELGDEVAIEQKHIVNSCYRRLSDCLGE
jgi:hypothetical protein